MDTKQQRRRSNNKKGKKKKQPKPWGRRADQLALPVDTEGAWVDWWGTLRSMLFRADVMTRHDFLCEWNSDDFEGIKSFGYFECPSCKKTWVSAHSYPDYTQGCKRCDTEYYPKFMWENQERHYPRDEDKTVMEETDKPHDMERCEACRAGLCLAQITGKFHDLNF